MIALARETSTFGIIETPRRLAERVLDRTGGLARALREGAEPYALEFEADAQGVRALGERPAVTFAQHVLERVRDAVSVDGRWEEEALIAHASHAMTHALTNDLAFRLTGLRRPVRPMTMSQVGFMNALLQDPHALLFGLGPTGTGKTHLAIAAGLHLLEKERFKTLVVTRPHRQAEGETMTAASRAEMQFDPQMTPLLDELHELIGHDETKRLLEKGVLEVTPIGRLRGRTLNDCFIVVDDAQNMSVRNMRMVVTRIGRNARMAITGDPSVHDLPSDEPSGLAHLLTLIEGKDLAYVHRFARAQIIRNNLVAQLEELYARDQ